jgi:hypothetical protein
MRSGDRIASGRADADQEPHRDRPRQAFRPAGGELYLMIDEDEVKNRRPIDRRLPP